LKPNGNGSSTLACCFGAKPITLETPFDYQQQLAFGILYIEEKPERVPALLPIEFDDSFVPLDQ
jgi:hypothetical protein